MITNYFPKKTWDNREFKKILSEDTPIEEAVKIKIALSNLSQLSLLANNKAAVGWVIDKKFIHKKTGKYYGEIKEETRNFF